MTKERLYNILIADGTDFYPEVTKKILGFGKHDCLLVTSYEEALKELKTGKYDLIMIDTEIMGRSGFELLEYVQKNIPNLPYIMTTENDIDKYMKPAVEKQVGNMLVKPMKRDEVLLLINKLITKKGIFGLENYVLKMKHCELTNISKTVEINDAITVILDRAEQWGFEFPNVNNIKLVLYEMIVNALYHSHGYTKQKLEREQIELLDGKYVELSYGSNDTKFGVSITDFNGKL